MCLQASGEDLHYFEDNSFDVVLVTLVLCTVQDAKKVLSEVKRVLNKNGKFFFLEHVAAKQGTFK